LPLALALTLYAAAALGAEGTGEALNDDALANSLSATFRRAISEVRPSIVTIEALAGPRQIPEWALRNRRQKDLNNDARDAEPNPIRQNSTGTGIVLDKRGFIITCYHVVADSDRVTVRLPDGRKVVASKIFSDSWTDISVIQISAANLQVAKFGNSDELATGDWVVSVGNPYSLGMSVSAGIVSATQRELPYLQRTRLIQTDAATNPGNSGGALINLRGEVVGISEGGYGVGEGFQGIGFAIPINEAKEIATRLINEGRIARPYLGCHTEAVSADIAAHLGSPNSTGLIVVDVIPDSPADRAGLVAGDLLTEFSGAPIREHSQLVDKLDRLRPGQSVSMKIFRERQMHSLKLELSERNLNTRQPQPISGKQRPEGFHDAEFGLTVDEFSAQLAKELGFDHRPAGVLVTDVETGSLADEKGVSVGMAIVRIDNDPVVDVPSYKRAIANRSMRQGSLVLLEAPRDRHFVLLKKK